ncbi:3-beta hydroxysteroid dehydrogenase/isomerase [Corchorus capsularis]|uniref:3-beta hydroxysteroid dehydrogenase/isomerase n=1 Tax=Corchorus capsularis TaxID=210143 RepID=A0A1R3KXS4_COCAP|nr:3-beta hydroxysteroid dehydrogenase/isomerase [Corchorus capsularis]
MIKLLLERGYSVHTTIRPDPENRRDISFLTTLAGANEKLKIFRADLSDPDSFDAGIEGCKGVIHVATPIDFQDKESEAAVTERAINGTLGILKACLKFKTVKKVVYTSSSAAVWYYSGRQDVDAEMMDETFGQISISLEKLSPTELLMRFQRLGQKGQLWNLQHNMDWIW